MVAEAIFIAIAGVVAGGIVNILADALPLRRAPRLPTYSDGMMRPLLAWLGITAFLFKLRASQQGNQADQSAKLGSGLESAPKPLLSWRYPLVELATAALMLASYFRRGNENAAMDAQMALWLLYAALFVLVAVIDLEHRRIPVTLLIPLAALALFDAAVFPKAGANLASAVFGGVFGFVSFYLVFAGGYLFVFLMSKLREQAIAARAFGFGDVMLMAAVGLIVGFPDIILAIYVSVFAGALGSLVIIAAHLIYRRSYEGFVTFPYGPFIVAGAVTVLLFGRELGALVPGN